MNNATFLLSVSIAREKSTVTLEDYIIITANV